jgi:methionine-rich copper-binding protein CopC
MIYLPINKAYYILKNNVTKHFLFFLLFIFIFISIGSIKADPTVVDELDASAKIDELTGFTFNSDGTRLYITGKKPSGNDRVSEYSLSVGFDLSSTVNHVRDLEHATIQAETGGWRPQDIEFSDDGTKMFLPMMALLGTSGVHQLDLSIPFDISSASSEYYFAPSSVTSGNPTGIEFNDTGTKMFLSIGAEVKEYTLSSAFDLQSTVTFVQSADLSAQTNPSGQNGKGIKELILSDDGTILFVVNKNPHNIYEYSLSSAFDVSNVTFIAKTADNFVKNAPSVGQEQSPAALAFGDNGSKLFFGGRDKEFVIESTLPGNYTLNLPTLSSHVPADDATGVSEVANIVLNFSEIVEAASTEKFITIKKGNDVVEAIDVRGSQVTGFGSTQITINPSVTLESQTAYHLLIDNGAIVDTAGASYAGISSDSTFNFTTGDTRPTLISSTPSDNASGVARDANIVLTFSEIVDVENGNITINNSSDDSVFESINVTSSNVTGTGTNQITINPTSRFEASTDYYILIDATAFDNVSGISYVGISSTLSLNFTTNNLIDPTTDKDVLGSINAQYQLAKDYILHSINIVSDRLQYLRQSKSNINLSSHNIKLDFEDKLLNPFINSLISKNDKSLLPHDWASWSTGTIKVSKIGDSLNASSEKTDGQGIAFGADKKLDNNDLVGAAIQFSQSDTDIGTNGTGFESENINLSIYGTRPLDENNFIEGLIGIGLIESDLIRVRGTNILFGSRNATQLFGSFNYGRTIDRGDFNLTPIARIDLGYTELESYSEIGIDALSYDKQSVENGILSLGLEISDIIRFNDEEFRPYGSIEYGLDFSSSSDAKMHYVSDSSTIYTYTNGANSDHLISSVIGFNYTFKDYLKILSNYRRIQGNQSEQTDMFNVSAHLKSHNDTDYSVSLVGSENYNFKFGISKDYDGLIFKFDTSHSIHTTHDEAQVSLTRVF